VEKTNTGIRTYGYDDIYQLTSAKYERGQAFTWEYDTAGNRLSSVEALAPTPSRSYVPNNLNQYASVNGVRYSYDVDGNLLTDGTRNFGWDIRNRLIQVTKEGKTINYKYDHNDLRVEKEVDGNKVRYYYDGSLLLCEKVGGDITKYYINDGEGIVGMVRPIYNESNILTHYQRLYYMYDSLGSVSVITGENGLPIQNYTYLPYGSTMNVEYDTINALRFVGRYGGYKDDDTELTYFWHRWYDEVDGRWVSRDPIGISGGINLFGYVNNRPNYFTDLTGLLTTCEVIRIIQSLVPTHGNYGGPGWTGRKRTGCGEPPDFSKPPQDAIDICFKEHDKCYFDKCKKKWECDVILYDCLVNYGFGYEAYGLTSALLFRLVITPYNFITIQ